MRTLLLTLALLLSFTLFNCEQSPTSSDVQDNELIINVDSISYNVDLYRYKTENLNGININDDVDSITISINYARTKIVAIGYDVVLDDSTFFYHMTISETYDSTIVVNKYVDIFELTIFSLYDPPQMGNSDKAYDTVYIDIIIWKSK